MSKELLKKYVEDVNKLRKRAKDINLNDEEINDIFEACFKHLKDNASCSNQPKAQHFLRSFLLKVFASLIFALLICYVILNVHQPTSSIVLRNVQGFIYPGLKLIRFLAVPIVKKFPSITKFYDESCLFENPYFFVTDMECWPCQNVYTVIDLTDFNNHSLYQSGIPYIVKTNQRKVKLENLKEIYELHKEIFDRDASTIKSTNNSLQVIGDLLDYVPNLSESSDVHISWRINRMVPARIVRTLFPRPHIISEWSGQSIERYILLDEPNARPRALPNFECSYVFIIQGSGEQTIILRPSHECGHRCKTVSVLLKPSFVLWYNWWYWRPISLPMRNSTEMSISYINSYC